ncbi:diacylglycerol kinase family protein [Eremococcus coleocola]|uniref:Prokaryotic diacylglycerol kinase n=1 Tax=Eremococcus coleocola ACS-139-V-Col8 TaxID=908337 RepID=E4KM28_9LACT|nr:diacylglycerol kinase family protein [Eremococcus coleocola]EFR31971.1 prokaryotic diacylglycerol kinase [Eremococcus coleocola ACS-139-V-Col8]
MDLKDRKDLNPFKRWLLSCGFALEGLRFTWKGEPNFKIHISILILVTIAGFFFGIARWEWVTLLICFAFILTLELINTALETLVNWIADKQWHPLAKITKDVAAGAVLVGAIIVAGIGLIIFVPYIWQYFLG